jgi:hypothetical protein
MIHPAVQLFGVGASWLWEKGADHAQFDINSHCMNTSFTPTMIN